MIPGKDGMKRKEKKHDTRAWYLSSWRADCRTGDVNAKYTGYAAWRQQHYPTVELQPAMGLHLVSRVVGRWLGTTSRVAEASN